MGMGSWDKPWEASKSKLAKTSCERQQMKWRWRRHGTQRKALEWHDRKWKNPTKNVSVFKWVCQTSMIHNITVAGKMIFCMFCSSSQWVPLNEFPDTGVTGGGGRFGFMLYKNSLCFSAVKQSDLTSMSCSHSFYMNPGANK